MTSQHLVRIEFSHGDHVLSFRHVTIILLPFFSTFISGSAMNYVYPPWPDNINRHALRIVYECVLIEIVIFMQGHL